MNLRIVCWFFGLLIKGCVGAGIEAQIRRCDKGGAVVSEGLLGETEVFPWLGLLKVYLREGPSSAYTVALTGIVYVKESYAIANADDIVKIPKRIFFEDSHAMFLPRAHDPWYCRLRDYMTHPEYEAQTLSSIALVELDPGKGKQFPIRPICWPSYGFNTSYHLYAMGYTDEGALLEKFINKVENIEQSFCKDFYEAAQLTGLTPTHYHCAHAQNRTDTCVWDNGMVLASNVTGYWILLGLGLYGPGCASPARFIDLLTYIPWIQSSTDLREDDSYRKSAFDYGFRYREQHASEQGEIPAHELLGRRYELPEGKHGFGHYQVQQRLDVEELFHIDRISGAEIVIHKYNATGLYGNCSDPFLQHVYSDSLRVTSQASVSKYFGGRPRPGTVQYRLSLYDLHVVNYTCVIIRAHSGIGSQAYLHYSTALTGGDLFQETPPDIIRVYPFHPRQKTVNVRPGVPEDDITRRSAHSLDLYLKYKYDGWGKLDIIIRGHPQIPKSLLRSQPR